MVTTPPRAGTRVDECKHSRQLIAQVPTCSDSSPDGSGSSDLLLYSEPSHYSLRVRAAIKRRVLPRILFRLDVLAVPNICDKHVLLSYLETFERFNEMYSNFILLTSCVMYRPIKIIQIMRDDVRDISLSSKQHKDLKRLKIFLHIRVS